VLGSAVGVLLVRWPAPLSDVQSALTQSDAEKLKQMFAASINAAAAAEQHTTTVRDPASRCGASSGVPVLL
jgi:hypothetical protein